MIERDGRRPIICDMGTGLREFGLLWGKDSAIEAAILVTHLHWDHVQGLPFFGPVHNPNSTVDIYGPPHNGQELLDSFRGLMQPPYFPIYCDELPTGINFVTVSNEPLMVDDAKVITRQVPHTGETNGYRVEVDGCVIAYVSDHQEPLDNPTWVDPGVLELCDGADVVIHDSQFTAQELLDRPEWGHCTATYALEVAAQAGAKRLCLFHHDPGHDDDLVDALFEECRENARDRGLLEVVAAAEGMSIPLGD